LPPPAIRARNAGLALLGAAVLVFKSAYSGPLEQVIHSHAGNFAAAFALYFAAVSATYRFRRPRLLAALSALVVVTSFEIADGFGLMANVYDPLDVLANGAGVAFAVAVDLLWSRWMSGAPPDDSTVG
jgi:hypothetical protein